MKLKRVGVVGLARSGRAAAELALAHGFTVYATDAADTPDLREAEAQLRRKGADVDLGRADVDKLKQVDALVVSPGIPPRAAPLDDPQLRSVKRISELEFASLFLKSKVIAVTGTNGKSTTTALTGHLLEVGGIRAAVAGNIGNALSNVAISAQQPEWVVVEASSFQLADIDCFTPSIGVVTNLAPDHLDRYASVQDYYNDKKKLFNNASLDSIWVLNGDDPEVLSLPGEAAGRRLLFTTESDLGDGEHGAFLSLTGELVLKVDSLRANLVHEKELPLLGKHNRANALAACLCAIGTGVPIPAIRDGLRSFAGLPHRLQIVARAGGITWINDSKATNVAATAVALRGVQQPTVLLLGGRHKGSSYAELLPHMQHVRLVIAYGESARVIEADLRGRADIVRAGDDFEQVVALATERAQPGDAVLLSPACSSFDMFRSYEERGHVFSTLARSYAEQPQ